MVRWFVIVMLWTAAVMGSDEGGAKIPTLEGIRLCQSYRLKDGAAVKVGKPKPCREKKQIFYLSQNLKGGSYVPQ